MPRNKKSEKNSIEELTSTDDTSVVFNRYNTRSHVNKNTVTANTPIKKSSIVDDDTPVIRNTNRPPSLNYTPVIPEVIIKNTPVTPNKAIVKNTPVTGVSPNVIVKDTSVIEQFNKNDEYDNDEYDNDKYNNDNNDEYDNDEYNKYSYEVDKFTQFDINHNDGETSSTPSIISK